MFFSAFNPFLFGNYNGVDINNRGIELALSGDLIKRTNFSFSGSLIFSSASNKVTEIPGAVDQIYLEGFFSNGLYSVLRTGENYGAVLGNTFRRINSQFLIDLDGSYVVNPFPQIIADPTPDFSSHGIFELRYKSFRLSTAMTFVSGGEFVSHSASAMLARGVTTDTQKDRELPIIKSGVQLNLNGDFVPIDYQVFPFEAYFNAGIAGNEGAIFDGSYFKLRELAFSWDVPQRMLLSTPLSSITLTAYGRNLLTHAPGFPEGINFDPEYSSTGSSNIRGLDFITGPATRTIGLKISIEM